jgi:hypothetical protein
MPVLTVHAILKGQLVEAGTNLPESEVSKWLRPYLLGGKNEWKGWQE